MKELERELDELLMVLCPPKTFSNHSARDRAYGRKVILRMIEEEKELAREEMRQQQQYYRDMFGKIYE